MKRHETGSLCGLCDYASVVRDNGFRGEMAATVSPVPRQYDAERMSLRIIFKITSGLEKRRRASKPWRMRSFQLVARSDAQQDNARLTPSGCLGERQIERLVHPPRR